MTPRCANPREKPPPKARTTPAAPSAPICACCAGSRLANQLRFGRSLVEPSCKQFEGGYGPGNESAGTS